MKIEMGKQYRTRSGLEVRIYAVDGYGWNAIHGAVKINDSWLPRCWRSDGSFNEFGDREHLVEVKPKHVRWVNFYKDSGYRTKEVADKNAMPDRIACVRFEVEEGEGLE